MPTISPDEKLHRELYQQAHAIFAVFNPTVHDYRLIFDRRIYTIPNKDHDIGKGKGIEYLSAYLAKKYATEMTNKILQEQAMGLVNEENERRKAAGMALLTKYPGDNPQEIIEAQIGVNDAKTRAPVMKQLILGLIQKAPEDIMLETEKQSENQGIPVDDQIFSSFENTMYSPQSSYTASPSVAPDLAQAKEQLINNLQTNNET